MDLEVGFGDAMRAAVGDWAVREGGKTWSVRDDIFRATHEEAGDGQWRRKGRVQARPAHPGETFNTLEGAAVAAGGDWVVRGSDGEQWPVPGEEFARALRRIQSARGSHAADAGGG